MTGALNTPPTLAGRYHLGRQLGRGAMGAVYLARDMKHGREVAIKVLAPETSHALDAERFLSEVRTAASLNHPHILTVHDSGEENGTLYYVMPRVEGESLRDLLDRERRLPVEQAVDFACQIAAGLAYAHAHGVVHRDIKPGNILIDGTGHAYIADFGLALALGSVGSPRRTEAGVAVGSPHYMSPEQAGGEADLDARSDVYAVGCVLFEILTGDPPFQADNVREVLLAHLTAPPPSLRSRRADVPVALDHAVRKALAKDPAERQANAEELRQALDPKVRPTGVADSSPPRRRRGRRHWVPIGVAIAAALLMVSVLWGRSVVVTIWGGAELDTMRYAILPFEREPGVPDGLREDLQLHEAFERWRELQIVSRLQVGDAVQQAGGPDLTYRDALDIARSMQAGRYVRGVASPFGDSIRLDVSLHDANGGGRELRQASAMVSPAEIVPVGAATRLADLLLFERLEGAEPTAQAFVTSSIAARRAYGAARAAIEVWDLPRADSLFQVALEHDPAFARAHLWLAQARDWAGEKPESWRMQAERAFRAADQLSPYEQALGEGLALLARGEFPAACEVYDDLRQRDEGDFAAWYGLGRCRELDAAVVADPHSPSGWSFRGSYHQAVEAYRTAYQVLPLTHHGATFERLPEVFFTRPNESRRGRAEDRPFAAFATLAADTLAFVPYPLDSPALDLDSLRRQPEGIAALLHQRKIVRALAERWAAAFPESPDALEAVAISLDMLGDPGAAQAYRRAMIASPDREQRLRLAIGEIWARVKSGVPRATEDLIRARTLADSILSIPMLSTPSVAQLAAVAILIGAAPEGAAYARESARADDWPIELPRSLKATGQALLVFAAAGGPVDSIARLEEGLRAAIRNTVAPDQVEHAIRQLLERQSILAAPVRTPAMARSTLQFKVWVGQALQLALAGDTVRAVNLLTTRGDPTGEGTAGGLSFDMLYPTAWLLAALGRPDLAEERLDAAFDALQWVQPGTFDDPAHAGALVRSLALRAMLAQDPPDREVWHSAFAALWSGAPAELRRQALQYPRIDS